MKALSVNGAEISLLCWRTQTSELSGPPCRDTCVCMANGGSAGASPSRHLRCLVCSIKRDSGWRGSFCNNLFCTALTGPGVFGFMTQGCATLALGFNLGCLRKLVDKELHMYLVKTTAHQEIRPPARDRAGHDA